MSIHHVSSVPRRWSMPRFCRWFGVAACVGLASAPVALQAAAATSGVPGYVILPLSYLGRSNQACIRVQINGKPTLLMLDTGASHTVLDSRFYQGARTQTGNINPDKLPPELRQNVNTNGEKANAGYIDSMTAGAMNFGQGPVIVLDMSRQFDEYNHYHQASTVGGLLGEDILRKYNALIDWRRRGVYFNVDPSKKRNSGAAFVAAGWTAVPMVSTNGHHFVVQCTIEGKPVRLLVDTGAQFTSLRAGVMPLPMIYNRDTRGEMGHLASNTGTMSMIGLDASANPARLEHWKIGGYEIERSNVAVNKFPNALSEEQSAGDGPLLGLLGAEVLASNNAVIDIANSTLYLKHNSH